MPEALPSAPVPLIYAGIDEAGYGPLLGPLCVGASVFRVDGWVEGEPAPDLWKALSGAVCRETRDSRRRIAVGDSKKLKLANSSVTKHPLTHLERGVLAFLSALASDAGDGAACPDSDLLMLQRLGVVLPEEAWYSGEAEACPVGTSAGAVGIASNTLRLALERAGVGVVYMKCSAIGEGAFNEIVQAAGTKAAATEAALVEHLWTIWERWGTLGAESGGGVRVVCDRQGGRAFYTEMLQRAFPGVDVQETHQSETQSRYELRGTGAGSEDGRARHMHVLFLVESEQHHLPVAMASMIAKLTRETLMARFNRHWRARLPELKPTAGYRGDGWRWIEEAAPVLTEADRRAMIRRA